MFTSVTLFENYRIQNTKNLLFVASKNVLKHISRYNYQYVGIYDGKFLLKQLFFCVAIDRWVWSMTSIDWLAFY